jgi:L-cysteine:1D-myo-inositol 2-amino-2-deoxy-alpha-D-glucopyranoside ligase
MTGLKERLEPLANPVTLYVCGVTPYDTTHLGHARVYVFFDVLQRYLRHRGMSVRYVQNVTDVDDPLLARARVLGMDYRDLARHYIDVFTSDLAGLNVLMPAVFPKATEEIPGMITTISVLIERGMAYPAGGSVYFRAGEFPRYGAMSRLDREAMLAANRDAGEDPADPNKDDPLDFRLWQAPQPGEPTWESPWGPGRPGWHIECSTMASRYLGNRIDIHGGGEDLIFPHHCSEIAQSEAATGEVPFVRHWVHVGLVWMDGEKMSKSRGNMAFVRDLLPRFGADALRFYLLGNSYRQRLEYQEPALMEAAERWRSIAAACRSTDDGPGTARGQDLCERILASLDDDLDTPAALNAIGELAALVRYEGAAGDRAALRSTLEMLGFRPDRSEA